MTIKSDALSRAITYDVTGDIDALDRPLHRDLEYFVGDRPYQNSTLDAVDEIITITPGDRTGGTFDLDFTLADGTTFSVDGLADDATASAVQTAVDSAAGDAVTGYTAGDIAVTGGPFGDGGDDTVFTFSGTSVRGDNDITGVYTSLTGGSTDPSETETQAGVVPRFWFAALKEMGVIEGTDPAFGATPNGQYSVNTVNDIAEYPRESTVRSLIKEATVQEGKDWETELFALLGYNRVASGVQL